MTNAKQTPRMTPDRSCLALVATYACRTWSWPTPRSFVACPSNLAGSIDTAPSVEVLVRLLSTSPLLRCVLKSTLLLGSPSYRVLQLSAFGTRFSVEPSSVEA